jgi:hypothetical protein
MCGNGYPPSGRRRYCSDNCRVAAWRARHHPTPPQPPVPPQGAKRAVTVYICDNCDSRALGEQYCPDCHTFMRAAGIGAECPCCSEPIAIAELTKGGDC